MYLYHTQKVLWSVLVAPTLRSLRCPMLVNKDMDIKSGEGMQSGLDLRPCSRMSHWTINWATTPGPHAVRSETVGSVFSWRGAQSFRHRHSALISLVMCQQESSHWGSLHWLVCLHQHNMVSKLCKSSYCSWWNWVLLGGDLMIYHGNSLLISRVGVGLPSYTWCEGRCRQSTQGNLLDQTISLAECLVSEVCHQGHHPRPSVEEMVSCLSDYHPIARTLLIISAWAGLNDTSLTCCSLHIALISLTHLDNTDMFS